MSTLPERLKRALSEDRVDERYPQLHAALVDVATTAESVDSMVQLIKRSNGKNGNLLFDLDDAHKSLAEALERLAKEVGEG